MFPCGMRSKPVCQMVVSCLKLLPEAELIHFKQRQIRRQYICRCAIAILQCMTMTIRPWAFQLFCERCRRQQQPGLATFQHVTHALCWKLGIQWQICCAGLQYGEQRDDEFFGSVEQHANDAAWSGTVAAQSRCHSVGAMFQLGIADAHHLIAVIQNKRGFVRVGLRLPCDHDLHRHECVL